MSGAGCEDGLFCMITGPGIEGTCIEPPASCGELSCGDSNCLQELTESCGGGAPARCSGFSGDFTIGCEGAQDLRVAGEACSLVVQCVEGTYCDIEDIATTGTCVALPAECADEASCACLQPVIDACPESHWCSVRNGIAHVACTE